MSDEPGTTLLRGAKEGLPQREAVVATDEQADLQHLRALLEESDVEGARRFVRELAGRWPDSAEVQHFARVLAPPRAHVIRGEPGRSLDREVAWLREHAHEYPGQWVAIHGDRLIAADPSFSVVRSAVQQTPGAEGALLHRCPKRRR